MGAGPWWRRFLREPPWWTVLLATVALTAATWSSIGPLRTEGRDLQQDYFSVHRIGTDVGIYERVTADEVAAMGTSDQGIPINAHPPTSVVLFGPFRLLDFSTTVVVWSVISLLALATAVWLAARQVGRRWLFWFVFALGWWYPLTFHLRFGQWSTIILLTTVLTWIGLESDRPALTGLPIAVAGAIKVTPLALVVVPLIHRRWRAVTWAAGGGLALAAIALALEPGAIGDFVGMSGETDDAVRGAFGNGSLFGLISRTFGGGPWIAPVADLPQLVDPLRFAAIALVVAATGFALVRTRDIGLQMSLVSMALLLVAPVTWRHADVILVLPAIVIVGRRFPRRGIALGLLALAASLTLVDHWAFALANRPPGGSPPLDWTAQLHNPGPITLLVVFAACLVSCAWRRSELTAPEAPATPVDAGEAATDLRASR